MRFFVFISCLSWALTPMALAQGPEKKATGQAVPNLIPDLPGAVAAAPLRFTAQRVAVKAPLGWQKALPSAGTPGTLVCFFLPSAFGATLSLAHSEDPGRTKLPDDLPAQIAAALAKRYPGFQQLGKQRSTVQGADAWRMDGQVKPAGKAVVVRNRQVYFCREGSVYIVTLTCKDEDFKRLAPSLDRLLATLEWIDERVD